MATDYGEKERAFIDSLKESSGRNLQEWMAAISAQDLAHRNDVILWLRQQGPRPRGSSASTTTADARSMLTLPRGAFRRPSAKGGKPRRPLNRSRLPSRLRLRRPRRPHHPRRRRPRTTWRRCSPKPRPTGRSPST
jgi:hypothetical protein